VYFSSFNTEQMTVSPFKADQDASRNGELHKYIPCTVHLYMYVHTYICTMYIICMYC